MLVMDAIAHLTRICDKGIHLKPQLKDELLVHRHTLTNTARTCRKSGTGSGI